MCLMFGLALLYRSTVLQTLITTINILYDKLNGKIMTLVKRAVNNEQTPDGQITGTCNVSNAYWWCRHNEIEHSSV